MMNPTSAVPMAIPSIAVRRRDELGRLLKSLAVMQASLKARADQDLALMSSKDQTHAQQVTRRQRIEAEIEAFRSTFTAALANTDRMTGELTNTAQTLSSIAHAAGKQSVETASTASAILSQIVISLSGFESRMKVNSNCSSVSKLT